MKKSQKIGRVLLISLIIVTIGLCILKIYSETTKNKDMITGNYYTKSTLKEAEFLGKFSEGSRWWLGGRGIDRVRRRDSYDEFKILESGEIIRIAFGPNGGHTGEKYVTIEIVDYYSKNTNKHIYQKFVIVEAKNAFDNKTDY